MQDPSMAVGQRWGETQNSPLSDMLVKKCTIAPRQHGMAYCDSHPRRFNNVIHRSCEQNAVDRYSGQSVIRAGLY